MNRPGGRHLVLALALLGLPIFFWRLGSYSVVSVDEAFYQRAAENMLRSGRWLTIHHGGSDLVFLMNSPLHFWARALVTAVLGENLWSMRILSALSGWLAVLMTYSLARRWCPRGTSLLAALVLLTSFQFVYLHGARTGELDAVVTLVFVWIVREFLAAVEDDRSFLRHHLGLIVLANLKLPLLLLPLLFQGIHFLVTPGHRRHARRWAIPLAAALPVALAWPALQAVREPEAFRYVVTRMLGELTGEAVAVDRGRAYFVWVTLFGMFPYSLVAPFAFFAREPEEESARIRRRLLRIVVVTLFAFFTITAKKYPWYILPAYPFLAVLMAEWFTAQVRAPRARLGVASLAAAAAGACLLGFSPPIENPFAERYFSFPSIGFAGTPDVVRGITLGVGVLAAALAVLRFREVPARRRAVVVAGAMLLAAGLARTVAPLRHTTYRSPTDLLARRLQQDLDHGMEIEFPVPIPRAPAGIREYYFGRRFRVGNDLDGLRFPHLEGWREAGETAGLPSDPGGG